MEKILIVDDDVAIVQSLRFAFKKQYELLLAYNSHEAISYYKNNEIAVTILDLKLGNEDGMELYNKIKEINPNSVVIIVTAFGTIKSSIEAIKSGIFQYLTKPIDLKELEFSIAKGIEVNNLHNKINKLEEKNLNSYESLGIITKSKSMDMILKRINKVKDIDSNVLITGQSGTGKGLIARCIHKKGNRSYGKFYSINCAAIPRDLLESELFGYKKGAFTGANNDKRGYFELANKGILFLDEIGDMDISLQGKLLHAIQEKKITPIGAEDPIEIDIRIIAATNKDLFQLMEDGKFREDLFYRLNVINIHLPPLKERKEDIPYLINYFVEKYSGILNKNIEKINSDFYNILESYDFKGNIRELENLIERAIALADDTKLTKKDLLDLDQTHNTNNSNLNCKLIPIFIGESLENIEKKVIEYTYRECSYNQRETAKVLGITDRTIRNKIKKYTVEEQN